MQYEVNIFTQETFTHVRDYYSTNYDSIKAVIEYEYIKHGHQPLLVDIRDNREGHEDCEKIGCYLIDALPVFICEGDAENSYCKHSPNKIYQPE